MKRFSFVGVLAVFVVCLLAVLTVKIFEIEDKIAQMARPTKLFNPSCIVSTFPHNPQWDVKISPSHDRFFHILTQQPLYWLGKGMQVTVFETEDKKYVVKFFLINHVKAVSERGWLRGLFSQAAQQKNKQRDKERDELFLSSKMCFEEIPEETGIIYVHLNRTVDKIKGVKLFDKFGQSHRIRGDDACFVVQKKVVYIVPTLVKLMDSGAYDKACQRLDQLFDLLLTMTKKGFIDNDDALIRNNNIGFTDNRAIYLDTGHLVRTPNVDIYKRMCYEFDVRLEPLQKWLDVMYPSLAHYFTERREAILNELKSESQKPA